MPLAPHRRRALLRRCVLMLALLAYAGLASLCWGRVAPEGRPRTSRSLLFTMDPLAKDETDGGLGAAGSILWLVLTLWLFVGIAVVSDEYFVPSLEKISEALNLSEDVAGATFLAAGSSAPEIFTSIVDTFIRQNEGFGIGTIVGSAVFNILGIVALSCIPCGRDGFLQLDWFPLFRDSLFYLLSLMVLTFTLLNGEVDWYESATLVALYGLYLLSMKFSDPVATWMKGLSLCGKRYIDIDVDTSADEGGNNARGSAKRISLRGSRTRLSALKGEAAPVIPKEEDERPVLEVLLDFGFPSDGSLLEKFLWLAALPWSILFRLTIPNCSLPALEKWYPVSFTMCVLWIGLLSMYMVKFVSYIGVALEVSPAIMGMVILAAGTSVPDALGSYLVAKRGQADAAVSNALGSNVINILVGLGIPWLISNIIDGTIISDGSKIWIPLGILVGTLALFLGVLASAGWRLRAWVGIAFLVLYVLFVLFLVLNEFVFKITVG